MKRTSIRKLGMLCCLAGAMAAPAAAQPNQLVITGAVPNFEDAILSIVGSNFGTGEPSVTLNGAALTLQTFSDTGIVADLTPLPPGSYLLEVSRGSGALQRDDFALAIGSETAAGDITSVTAGSGLAGGGASGDVALEVDFGALDGNYARLDAENFFSQNQYVPNLYAQLDVSAENLSASGNVSGETAVFDTSVPGNATLIVHQSATNDGVAISAESHGENQVAVSANSMAPTGFNVAVQAIVESPDAVAGLFLNQADGKLLAAGSPTYGEVFQLSGEGRLNLTTDYTPGPGDQIFVADVLATATSGHVRGFNSTTFSPDSIAVVGSAQPSAGGLGGLFDSYGVGGAGVEGIAQATTGFSNGVVGHTNSADGVGGWFRNDAGGRILLGSSDLGEVFQVEGDGTVRANAYTDLFGNPIGDDGVGVFEVATGSGLTGGPITGSGTIEVDFGALDGSYARLDAPNVFSASNEFNGSTVFNGATHQFNGFTAVSAASDPGASVFNVDNFTAGAIGIAANAFGPGSRAITAFGDTGVQAAGFVGVSAIATDPNGIGLLAEALEPSGSGFGLLASSGSPSGVAGLFENGAGGSLIRAQALQAASGTVDNVFEIAGDGVITQSSYGADLLVGNAYNAGTMALDEVFRVASDGTVTATAVVETSSEQFKTNIAPLDGALATVRSLRGVSFDWKRDGQHDIGLVAEEVARVLPEVVHAADGEVQGVNYGRLTAVLIEAVKEQQAQIERLEGLLERLLAER